MKVFNLFLYAILIAIFVGCAENPLNAENQSLREENEELVDENEKLLEQSGKEEVLVKKMFVGIDTIVINDSLIQIDSI